MKLFYGGSPTLIRTQQRIDDVKWIDIKVSGYWIFNLSRPDESDSIVEEWKNINIMRLKKNINKFSRTGRRNKL